jgi:hypothetical protein
MSVGSVNVLIEELQARGSSGRSRGPACPARALRRRGPLRSATCADAFVISGGRRLCGAAPSVATFQSHYSRVGPCSSQGSAHATFPRSFCEA